MKTSLLIFILVASVSFSLFEFQDSFAVRPTLETTATATSPGIGANTIVSSAFTISGGDADKLLVYGISMRQTATSDEELTAVTLTGCSGVAGATAFTKVMDTDNGLVRTEIWTLDDTPAMSLGAGDCTVTATLSAGDTFGSVLATAVKATMGIALYSDVDQTTPVSTSAEATGTSTTPTVSLDTNEHNRVFNAAASQSGGGLPTAEAGQDSQTIITRYISAAGNNAGHAVGHADGKADPTATSQGWTLNAASTWSISAVAIRSTSDDNTTAASSDNDTGDGTPSGACSGDCQPPTLGVNEEGQRLVEGGFTYNDQTADSELFYTPFPLITTSVGEENVGIFKIYENEGSDRIRHFELVFGLKKGEIIGDSLAKIVWDKSWDGIESVTLVDPQKVFSNVHLDIDKGKCMASSTKNDDCLVITVTHTFRKPLDFDIVGTSIWDHRNNQWSNYFNHGVRIVGESLDPPPVITVAFGTNQMRGLYDLTQLDSKTDTWVDEFGNVYKNNGNNFFEKISILKQDIVSDYARLHELESNVANQELLDFMSSYYKTSLGSTEPFSEINDITTMTSSENYDKLHHIDLVQKMNLENTLAEITMQQQCPKCTESEFSEINNIKRHDSSDQFSKTQDPLNKKIMHEEYLKSLDLFNNYYGYIYNDELILLEPAKILYDTKTHVDKNTIIENEQLRAQKTTLAMYGSIADFD